MTEHEVLVAARNRLAKRGAWWRQGDWRGGFCHPVCVSIALSREAVQLGAPTLSGHRALCEVLGIDYSGARALGDLFRWNDAPGRRKREVLAALDRAITATAPLPADPFAGAVLGLEPKAEASSQEPVSDALLEEPKEAA